MEYLQDDPLKNFEYESIQLFSLSLMDCSLEEINLKIVQSIK